MKKLLLVLSGFFLSNLVACSPIDSLRPFDAEQARNYVESTFTPRPAQQRIIVGMPKNQRWKKVSTATHGPISVVRLIPTDSNMNNWRESIQTNIQGYLTHHGLTAKQFALNEMNYFHNQCQSRVAIIEETPFAIIYKMDLLPCRDIPAQRQMVKAFNGSDGVYAIRYVALNSISETQFSNMTTVIKRSYIENNPGV